MYTHTITINESKTKFSDRGKIPPDVTSGNLWSEERYLRGRAKNILSTLDDHLNDCWDKIKDDKFAISMAQLKECGMLEIFDEQSTSNWAIHTAKTHATFIRNKLAKFLEAEKITNVELLPASNTINGDFTLKSSYTITIPIRIFEDYTEMNTDINITIQVEDIFTLLYYEQFSPQANKI